MIRVKSSQFVRNLPYYLNKVAKGETVVIMRYLESIAVIKPVTEPNHLEKVTQQNQSAVMLP